MSVIVFAAPAVAIVLPRDRTSATHVDRLRIDRFIFSTSFVEVIIECNGRAGYLSDAVSREADIVLEAGSDLFTGEIWRPQVKHFLL